MCACGQAFVADIHWASLYMLYQALFQQAVHCWHVPFPGPTCWKQSQIHTALLYDLGRKALNIPTAN